MGQGFKRLRLVAAAGVAGTSVVPVMAPPAGAEAFELPFMTFTGTGTMSSTPLGTRTSAHGGAWALSNGTEPSAFGAPGYGIGSAADYDFSCTYVSALVTYLSTCDPSTFRSDAFDGAAIVKVGGSVYREPDGIVDVRGSTVRAGATKLEGISTSVRHDFLGEEVVRVLVTLTNPKSRTVRKTVSVSSAFGGGNATAVHGSSNGNTALEAPDAWFIATGAPVPALIGRGDAAKGAVTSTPAGTGKAVDSYSVSIKPRKTVRLLYYVAIGSAASDLTAISDRFDNTAALAERGYLDGLTAKELGEITNWSRPAPAAAAQAESQRATPEIGSAPLYSRRLEPLDAWRRLHE